MLGAEQRDQLDARGAEQSTSIVELTAAVRPVWFVTSPTRLPAARGSPPATRTSIPQSTGRIARWRPAWAASARASSRRRSSSFERPRGRIDDRRGDQRGDLGPEGRRRRASAVGMEPAGQEDHERLGLGIDPEARAGEPGVAEAGRPEQGAARARCTASPTSQPSPRRWPSGVEPGSTIARTVSGESTRRPSSPLPPSSSIWAKTPGRRPCRTAPHGRRPRPGPATSGRGPPPGASGPPLAARSARSARRGPARRHAAVDGPEAGVGHPQGVEDPLPGELVERLPATFSTSRPRIMNPTSL